MFLVMTDFLENFSITFSSHYRFIERKGTQPMLQNLADEPYLSLESNWLVSTLFFDVSKAFDSVCYNVALDKLHRNGFYDPFLSIKKK